MKSALIGALMGVLASAPLLVSAAPDAAQPIATTSTAHAHAVKHHKAHSHVKHVKHAKHHKHSKHHKKTAKSHGKHHRHHKHK